MNKWSSLIMAAVTAGFVASHTLRADETVPAPVPADDHKNAAKEDHKNKDEHKDGENSCKGKGGCKGHKKSGHHDDHKKGK